jgi:hypothetical protein
MAGLKGATPVPSMSRAAFTRVNCDEAASAIAEPTNRLHKDNNSIDRCKHPDIMSFPRGDSNGALTPI